MAGQIDVMTTGGGETLQPLDQSPPLRELVHRRLEALITEGNLRPGTKVREGELAATLGVSRGPVREALQILAQDGYVDLRPRQGAYVHNFTRREVEDLFDVRVVLEGESARLAALRATPDDHERLRAVLERARHGLDRPEGVVGSTWVGIHAVISATADNKLLGQMLDALEKRFLWYLSTNSPRPAPATWEEHTRIIDAIIAGDASLAKRLMVEHVEHSKVSFLQRTADTLR